MALCNVLGLVLQIDKCLFILSIGYAGKDKNTKTIGFRRQEIHKQAIKEHKNKCRLRDGT